MWRVWSRDRLTDEADSRHDKLNEVEKSQQYYFDANEAIAWMGDQELYMMASDKAKVSSIVHILFSFFILDFF